MSKPPEVKPRALSINDACRVLRISRTTIYKLAAHKKIKIARLGGTCPRIPMSEIDRLLEAQAGMMQSHIRLATLNGASLDNLGSGADEFETWCAYYKYCEALTKWQAARPHSPHSPLRLEALAAFTRFSPEAAAGINPKTWGFN